MEMHGNKRCLLPCKKRQMNRRKVRFMKTSRTWPRFPRTNDFFLKDFNSSDLISWDFISSSHIILGKKSPRNLKLRTLFPVTCCPRTLENWNFLTKVFISRFFFTQKLFSCHFNLQIDYNERFKWPRPLYWSDYVSRFSSATLPPPRTKMHAASTQTKRRAHDSRRLVVLSPGGYLGIRSRNLNSTFE